MSIILQQTLRSDGRQSFSNENGNLKVAIFKTLWSYFWNLVRIMSLFRAMCAQLHCSHLGIYFFRKKKMFTFLRKQNKSRHTIISILQPTLYLFTDTKVALGTFRTITLKSSESGICFIWRKQCILKNGVYFVKHVCLAYRDSAGAMRHASRRRRQGCGRGVRKEPRRWGCEVLLLDAPLTRRTPLLQPGGQSAITGVESHRASPVHRCCYWQAWTGWWATWEAISATCGASRWGRECSRCWMPWSECGLPRTWVGYDFGISHHRRECRRLWVASMAGTRPRDGHAGGPVNPAFCRRATETAIRLLKIPDCCA